MLAERLHDEAGAVRPVERLQRELSDQAKGLVPDAIKADALQSLRAAILPLSQPTSRPG